MLAAPGAVPGSSSLSGPVSWLHTHPSPPPAVIMYNIPWGTDRDFPRYITVLVHPQETQACGSHRLLGCLNSSQTQRTSHSPIASAASSSQVLSRNSRCHPLFPVTVTTTHLPPSPSVSPDDRAPGTAPPAPFPSTPTCPGYRPPVSPRSLPRPPGWPPCFHACPIIHLPPRGQVSFYVNEIVSFP